MSLRGPIRAAVVCGILLVRIGAGSSAAAEEHSRAVSQPSVMQESPATRESSAVKPTPTTATASQPAAPPPAAGPWRSWLAHPWLTGDWFGRRMALDDTGITFDVKYLSAWSQNWRGGLRTHGAVYRQLWDLGIHVDTQKLLGWPGGTIATRYSIQSGRDGSKVLVGDFQRFSNIDAPNRDELYLAWYEQRFFDDRLALRIGKIDANDQFARPSNGTDFSNSSFGYSPTLLYFPTYIDPAMGATLFVYPTDWLYFGFGAFDGSLLDGVPTGELGPQTLFDGLYFYVAEAGASWGGSSLPGKLGLGGWYHTGVFERYKVYRREGPRQHQDGTGGFYMVFDQTLWKENDQDPQDNQGLGMFAQYGWADQVVSPVNHYVGAGLAWTGALPRRDHDVTGLGFAYVHFSTLELAGFTKDYECAIEWFYKLQITPSISIKPDIQYILNPGGKGLADAMVGTLRIEIDF